MFFEGDRIKSVREMILADDEAGRRVALAKLLPIQRGDSKPHSEHMWIVLLFAIAIVVILAK